MGPVVVLLTFAEVCDRLRKTTKQGRYLMQVGDFPKTAKIGGRIMVREQDLNVFIEQKFADA